MICRRSLGLRRPAEQVAAALLERLFKGVEDPILVAIGGPGGTGKSTFSQKLQRQLEDSVVVRLDDYKTARAARREQNLYGAHPAANRIKLLQDHLGALKNGVGIEKPVYDSVSGSADETERIEPKHFVILDGEISTYQQFRHLIDFAIFIDSDWKTQLQTRISRDIEVRKYSQEKAIATFLQSNLREFAEHGAESKTWADLHLYCDSDYSLRMESVDETLRDHVEALAAEELLSLDLSGLMVPVTTPFAANDDIDRTAFVEHLEWLAHNGVHRVLVNGTTGEFFSLTGDERRLVLTLARQYFPGMVLFQAGSDSLRQAQEEARWADDYGADAILALPPYYFAGAPKEGLVEFFRTLAKGMHTPLLLYNFPLHTQNPITAEMLSRIPHFGIKDSGGDFSLIKATEHYFVAGDARIVQGYEAGACGFFSGLANMMPERYVALEKALKSEDHQEAQRVQIQITGLVPEFTGNSQIGKIKHGISMSLPGYPTRVRLPLLPATIVG